MISRPAMRLGAALVASVLAVSAVAPSASAAPADLSSTAASTPAVVSGQVILDAGASATRDATATVTVAAPMGPASQLRVSNDAGATWVERSYAVGFAWSLVDPAAGGVDEDGPKTVTVEAGDGIGPWVALGSDTILLDRTPPTVTPWSSYFGWSGYVDYGATDTGVGLARVDVSLDGVHWRSLNPTALDGVGHDFLDFREGIIGGTWATGPRQYFLRGVDRLGNVSPAAVGEAVLTPTASEIPGVTFELPLPAVTGQPFTIKPVFAGAYRIPSGRHCEWNLSWGSEASFYTSPPDENWGMVTISRAPKNGVCEPWTLTLPYTPPLVYRWHLSIMRDIYDDHLEDYGTTWMAGTFRATAGSTYRGIVDSNFLVYYLLPNRSLVPTDGTVTYQLHAAGTTSVPTNGFYWCNPADPPGGWNGQSQQGGTSFTCRVTRAGPWVADWARWTSSGYYWRSEYDPVSDRSRPAVTAPVVRVGPSASPSATYPPVSVSWSGKDVGTGISRYELQRSINSGSYRAVALPSARATTLDLRLRTGYSYRFRVRARDRAGNWSSWAYSAVVRAAHYEETSSTITWSSGWTRRAAPGASGGAVRDALAAGRSATFRFSGRAVGWFARRGPGYGFAQVRVDGVLVATVNLETATPQPSSVLWRRAWATSAAHVVQVRLLGTAGRPRVEVDSFEVLR